MRITSKPFKESVDLDGPSQIKNLRLVLIFKFARPSFQLDLFAGKEAIYRFAQPSKNQYSFTSKVFQVSSQQKSIFAFVLFHALLNYRYPIGDLRDRLVVGKLRRV